MTAPISSRVSPSTTPTHSWPPAIRNSRGSPSRPRACLPPRRIETCQGPAASVSVPVWRSLQSPPPSNESRPVPARYRNPCAPPPLSNPTSTPPGVGHTKTASRRPEALVACRSQVFSALPHPYTPPQRDTRAQLAREFREGTAGVGSPLFGQSRVTPITQRLTPGVLAQAPGQPGLLGHLVLHRRELGALVAPITKGLRGGISASAPKIGPRFHFLHTGLPGCDGWLRHEADPSGEPSPPQGCAKRLPRRAAAGNHGLRGLIGAAGQYRSRLFGGGMGSDRGNRVGIHRHHPQVGGCEPGKDDQRR